MADTGTKELNDHYRSVAAALLQDPPMPLEDLRDLVDHWGDVTTEPGGVDYTEVNAGGIAALLAVPKGADADRSILCLHGGGYINGSMFTHRKMFAHIAKAANIRALIINYRRTPEHQYPAPIEDAATAYRWLLDQTISGECIGVIGDSAGGHMSAMVVMQAKAAKLSLPGAVGLISPWLDLTLAGATMQTNRMKDVLFGGERPMSVASLVQMFLGNKADPRDPSINPLYADLVGFPRTYIQVGSHEILLDDSRRFAERAREAKVDVTIDIFEGQQHTFQMAAGRSSISDEAVARMGAWLADSLKAS